MAISGNFLKFAIRYLVFVITIIGQLQTEQQLLVDCRSVDAETQQTLNELFQKKPDTKPLNPDDAMAKIKLAFKSIKGTVPSRIRYGANWEKIIQHDLLETAIEYKVTDLNCSEDMILRHKSSFRDSYGSDYPALQDLFNEIVEEQVGPCAKRLDQSVADKLQQASAEFCSRAPKHKRQHMKGSPVRYVINQDQQVARSSKPQQHIALETQVDVCEIDPLNELKAKVRENYPDDKTNMLQSNWLKENLHKLAQAIGEHLDKDLNTPTERLKDESWLDYRSRLRSKLEEAVSDKCRANLEYFKDESFRFDELLYSMNSHPEGLQLQPTTKSWMETINLCRVLVDDNPFDVYILDMHNIFTLDEELFSRYVRRGYNWKADKARDQLELFFILTEASKEKYYKGRDLDLMLYASKCEKSCDRLCFDEMKRLGKLWKTCGNLLSIFSGDYKRQFDNCVARVEQHFKDGVKKLERDFIHHPSASSLGRRLEQTAKVAANEPMAALNRLKGYIESVLPKQKSPYSMQDIRIYFPNGLALYWANDRNSLNFFSRRLDNITRFRKRLLNDTKADCERLEKLRMLEWNDRYGQLDPEEIKEELGPEGQKWIVISNICRVILHESLGLEDAHMAVEGIV